MLAPRRAWLLLPLLAAAAAGAVGARAADGRLHAHWSLDPARSYDTTYADGTTYAGGGQAPRPILVNVWYPRARQGRRADAARRLPRRDSCAGADPRLGDFARALEAYARGIVADELLDEPDAEARASRTRAVEEMLSAPALAVRTRRPAAAATRWSSITPATAPLRGRRGFLRAAGQPGYVVAGSAGPAADGKAFNIDAHDGSLRDFEFLIASCPARPDVTRAPRAGGHSGGAHMILRRAAAARRRRGTRS
jgi:hypothetical protein